MLPAFRAGQLVIFVKWLSYKPGDVVMIRHDGLEKIKRIEKIDGSKVFLAGDNSANSTDSRHFGWVSDKLVKGKRLNFFSKGRRYHRA